MTGFGDASGRQDDLELFVEVRSVNNKYFKSVMRLPEELQPLEPEIESQLRHALSRGTVTLRVTASDATESAAMEVNHRALDRYAEQVLRSRSVADGRITLDAGSLLTLPGVLQPPRGEEERLNRFRALLTPLVAKACQKLLAMRDREGELLAAELMTHHATIAENLTFVADRAPTVVADYERRLKQRIDTLIADAGTALNPVDVVREIAVYAERTDIAEEVSRLRGHLLHFQELIHGAGGSTVGRTLEFLSQEMLREANTIASKSPDAEISRRIVDAKGAIDRIKEQVLNVA